MAKKKFNKEERLAIIKKLTKIAKERTEASWKKYREAYKPSSEYQKVKMLLEQRNSACEKLTEQSRRGQVPYASIRAQIPEFNPFYLKSYKAEFFAINQQLLVGLEFWWEVTDVESRIKALDALIEIYEDIDREFVW